MFTQIKLGLRLLLRPMGRFFTHGGVDYAGNVAFLCFLALFPFLIFLTNLAAMFEETQAAEEFIAWGLTNMPPAAASTIEPIINDVLDKSNSSALTLSILGALWVSANALESLRAGLNRVYGITRPRGFVFHRLQGAFMVLITASAIIIAAVLDVLLPTLLSFISPENVPQVLTTISTLSQIFFVPVIMIGATILLYRFLPDADHGFRNVLPGALLAYGLWIVLAEAFGYFLRNFGNYNVVYGSLGGVIVLLLFIYLAASVFLMGAEFNVVLEENKKEKEAIKIA